MLWILHKMFVADPNAKSITYFPEPTPIIQCLAYGWYPDQNHFMAYAEVDTIGSLTKGVFKCSLDLQNIQYLSGDESCAISHDGKYIAAQPDSLQDSQTKILNAENGDLVQIFPNDWGCEYVFHPFKSTILYKISSLYGRLYELDVATGSTKEIYHFVDGFSPSTLQFTISRDGEYAFVLAQLDLGGGNETLELRRIQIHNSANILPIPLTDVEWFAVDLAADLRSDRIYLIYR
jgi:hypothetical protein